MNQHHRYHIKHNGAILYFLPDGEHGEHIVTLNANGTAGCQHNGIQECGAACEHVEAAKLLEIKSQAEAQKYYEHNQEKSGQALTYAPLN